jgi:hypothetical protein
LGRIDSRGRRENEKGWMQNDEGGPLKITWVAQPAAEQLPMAG